MQRRKSEDPQDMKNSITPNQIKQNNRNLIYQYIYQKKKVSQQEICIDLRLSRPTVTAKLNELEEEGLIRKDGQISSEFVGRKAAAYTITADYRAAIGVEILKDELKMIAVDLYGNKIDRAVSALPYENSDDYYKKASEKVLEFKEQLQLREEQISGIGFAMQALVTPDSRTVLYGKILDCTGLDIEVFERYLPYPCAFWHDAGSAAAAELWSSPETKDAFYLSIGTHLGAAMISEGKIISGKHGHTATIEHIQVQRENGKPCYCGRHGCMETLCSLSALLAEGESAEEFFDRLRNGVPEYSIRWNIFLLNLADAINLLHLVYDTDFILGGYIAPYLTEDDIEFLHQEISRQTPFLESMDFIRISRMPKHNVAIGAALPFIREFLREQSFLPE